MLTLFLNIYFLKVIVNGTVLLILFSEYLLLVCRHVVAICIFTLLSATLLILLVLLGFFLDPLRFCTQDNACEYSFSFSSFFLIWMPFTLFIFLISLAKTSTTMLT